MPIDPVVLAAWVESSCADQDVPVHVSDATVLARVGALLGGPSAGADARRRRPTTAPKPGRHARAGTGPDVRLAG